MRPWPPGPLNVFLWLPDKWEPWRIRTPPKHLADVLVCKRLPRWCARSLVRSATGAIERVLDREIESGRFTRDEVAGIKRQVGSTKNDDEAYYRLHLAVNEFWRNGR